MVSKLSTFNRCRNVSVNCGRTRKLPNLLCQHMSEKLLITKKMLWESSNHLCFILSGFSGLKTVQYKHTRSTPQNGILFMLTFKLQSPSKYSPCDAIHILRQFSYCSKWFWTHQFWSLLVLLMFLSHLFHISKRFPFEDYFQPEKQTKKVAQGETRWIGRVGHWGQAVFDQEVLNTQHGVGRCAHYERGKHTESLPKKFGEAKHSLSQHHQLVHWYRRVPRSLN